MYSPSLQMIMSAPWLVVGKMVLGASHANVVCRFVGDNEGNLQGFDARQKQLTQTALNIHDKKINTVNVSHPCPYSLGLVFSTTLKTASVHHGTQDLCRVDAATPTTSNVNVYVIVASCA